MDWAERHLREGGRLEEVRETAPQKSTGVEGWRWAGVKAPKAEGFLVSSRTAGGRVIGAVTGGESRGAQSSRARPLRVRAQWHEL